MKVARSEELLEITTNSLEVAIGDSKGTSERHLTVLTIVVAVSVYEDVTVHDYQ